MRARSILAAAVAVLAGGAGVAAQQHLAAAPAAAEAQFAGKAAPIRFDLFRGNRIFFPGTVNGRPAQIMLDSGAATSVVSQRFAAAAGIAGGTPIEVRGASGSTTGRLLPGVTLGVGTLTLRSTVVVLDLAEVERGIGRPIDVVLGRDAFDAGIVDLDFERHEIRFLPRAEFMPPPGAVKLAMTRAHGIRKIPVAIGDRAPILADLDLGHGGSFMLAQSDWKADAALAGLPGARARAGGVGGLSDKRAVTLPSVTVAGQRFERVPALFNLSPDDLPTAGANIGIDVLQRFRLAVDFGSDSLWLEPIAGATARPLPKDRLGMRLELAGDALRVVYVSPDGPAARAGWKEGDMVTAINEVRVSPDFYASRYASFTRLAPGTRLDMVRGDGRHLPVVLTDFF